MKIKKTILFIMAMTLIFSFSAGVYADEIKFNDVKETDWFAEDVSSLSKLGIINGKPQGKSFIFDSKGLVTKSEFTKMLIEAMDYTMVDGNSFKDLDNHWAKKYIETAVQEDIIDPKIEGENYWPYIPIKRNDMAFMMFQALKLKESENKSPFPDADIPFVTKLYEEFLINGVISNNGNIYYNPDGLTTRAEAATIIARLIKYKDNPKAYTAKKQAEKEKKKKEEEFYKNIDKGVSQTLLDRKITLNDDVWYETFMEAHEDVGRYLQKGIWYEKVGAKDLDEFLDMCESFGREWINIDWNIDYRKLDGYREKAEIMMQEFRVQNYLDRMINGYTDNKAVLESKFYTGRSLIATQPFFGIYGTLQFRFLEPTNLDYISCYIDKDTNKPIKLNTWYEADVRLNLAPGKGKIESNRLEFLDYVGRQDLVRRVK